MSFAADIAAQRFTEARKPIARFVVFSFHRYARYEHRLQYFFLNSKIGGFEQLFSVAFALKNLIERADNVAIFSYPLLQDMSLTFEMVENVSLIRAVAEDSGDIFQREFHSAQPHDDTRFFN